MRKLVLFMHVSLDGYASDSNGGLDWIPYNEELEKYAEEIVAEVGAPVYGRTTYRMMESYWPTVLEDPNASRHEMEHAKWLQDVKKIVISGTMDNGMEQYDVDQGQYRRGNQGTQGAAWQKSRYLRQPGSGEDAA